MTHERPRVSLRSAARTWAKIGLLSFGGPAGQIAVMHRILVEEKRWIGESRFMHALNYCMLLPGPEATQLATYVGWLMHGVRGGLVAGTLFVLPGFLSILALSILYALYRDTGAIAALFFGLKAATLAVVVEAVIRIAKRALKNRASAVVAAGAFVAIFFFEAPFPLIVFSAGLVGLVGGRFRPDLFHVLKGHEEDGSDEDALLGDRPSAHQAPSRGRSLRTLVVGLSIWFAPVAILFASLGPDHVLTTESLFFSKAAVVTFGGAYAVLAYVAQQAVDVYGWLKPGEMLDGLGMAETTPGPLIQVVQFVGFMGAYRNFEPFGPMTAAILASVVTTWVTFVPCFLWIFLGAPYVERLRGAKLLSAGLSAITAAVVGVVLNLAVWFGVHAGFGRVEERRTFGLRLLAPDLSSADVPAILVALGAFVALFKLKWNVVVVLGAAAATGLLYKLVIGPALFG